MGEFKKKSEQEGYNTLETTQFRTMTTDSLINHSLISC